MSRTVYKYAACCPDCCPELQEAEAGARGPGSGGDPPAQEAGQTRTRHQPNTCQVGLYFRCEVSMNLFAFHSITYLEYFTQSVSQGCVFLLLPILKCLSFRTCLFICVP